MSPGNRGVVIRDNLWWNFATNEVPQPYWQNANAQWALSDAANSNLLVDPMLRSISRTNLPAFRLDPRPKEGSPALTSPITAPNDGFYTPVNNRGAFADVNWASDWTFAAESGLISGEGAGQPKFAQVPAPPTSPMLMIRRAGSDLIWGFPTENGRTYQIQSVSGLEPGNSWSDQGTPISGTGSPIILTNAIGAGNMFIRVRAQ